MHSRISDIKIYHWADGLPAHSKEGSVAGVGEQQPFPRRTVTGSLSCQTSSPPSRPHARRTPPTTILSPTWSNFTTSEGSCGQRRKRAAHIIVGSTLIIPFLPPAWGCSSHSRGCSLPNCLQCDCLSKVVEGIKTSPYPRERIRVKEKEGLTKRAREGRGAEILAKSCQDAAAKLREVCWHLSRNKATSSFRLPLRAQSNLISRKAGARAGERRGPHCTRRPDLSRQFPRQSLTALARHITHARAFPRPKCWPQYYELKTEKRK